MPTKSTEAQSDAQAQAEVSKAFAEKPAETSKEKAEEGTVKYIGAGSTRTISRNAWSKVGIVGDNIGESRFDISNNFTLKKSDFNQDQLDILKQDGSFVIG